MKNLTVALLTSSLALAACGGDDAPSKPIGTATPTPTPSATATATPTPSPTPSPTGDPGGALLGGLEGAGTLVTETVCYEGGTTVTPYPTTLVVDPDYNYTYNFTGYGSTTFPSSSRIGGTAFEVFVNFDDRLEIAKLPDTLEFATYGYFAGTLCFFAGAPQNSGTPPASGQKDYMGVADGLRLSGGDGDRLYGSAATIFYTGSNSTYTLTIRMKAIENASDEPAGQPQFDLGNASATIKYQNGKFLEAPLVAPGGYTGSIRGVVGGVGFIGATFTFSMSNPSGEVIFGVIAADGAQI